MCLMNSQNLPKTSPEEAGKAAGSVVVSLCSCQQVKSLGCLRQLKVGVCGTNFQRMTVRHMLA